MSNMASSWRGELTFRVHYGLDGDGYSMKLASLIARNFGQEHEPGSGRDPDLTKQLGELASHVIVNLVYQKYFHAFTTCFSTRYDSLVLLHNPRQ